MIRSQMNRKIVFFIRSTGKRERDIGIENFKQFSGNTDEDHSSMKFGWNRRMRKESSRFGGHQNRQKQPKIESTDFKFENRKSCVLQKQERSDRNFRDRLRIAEVITR